MAPDAIRQRGHKCLSGLCIYKHGLTWSFVIFNNLVFFLMLFPLSNLPVVAFFTRPVPVHSSAAGSLY